MAARRKDFNRMFARLSPVFVSAALVILFALPSPARDIPASDNTPGAKRQAALSQFERAEDQRTALNQVLPAKRTLSAYKQTVLSYRRVYLITPHAAQVPDALEAVAELYTEMGDRFGRNYYQQAVDSYQFLLREYPTSRYAQDAMLRMAGLQKDQLGDAAQASKTYQQFLKNYHRSAHRREAQEALAELALRENMEASAPAAVAPTERRTPKAVDGDESKSASATAEETPRAPRENNVAANSGQTYRVRHVSTSAAADSTRVTIDVEGPLQYISGRIGNPERIFFDLRSARLTPELARENIQVEGDLLTGVRVAQNQTGVVRVVLDVNGVKDYSAALQKNPPQLIIDLSSKAAPLHTMQASRTHPQPIIAEPATITMVSRESVDTTQPPMTNAITGAIGSNPGNIASVSPAVATSTPSSRRSNSGKVRPSSLSAKSSSTAKPELIQPASAPMPTRDGQATLTRALGLKISRIVIDAGHGGHDTGTVGPTGLMEKDLCLDVAVRLGKMIQQRLPGAEVIYTRSDDTFIPLEERTHIANEAKADLFISIHANSSSDRGTRGIETYYLNLRGSAEAMEVASRENATSQEGIHDLGNIVKKIAQTEKIDESKEFATDIQDSLEKSAKIRNRGVRKAPFVVLIGADMPSILTEISFLSNPSDEQLLKQPEQRQRVAEGLYQGVANYLQNLNSMTVNLPLAPAPHRSATISSTATVEQSRSQQ